MAKINDSAFPDTLRANSDYIGRDDDDIGLTKFEYTAIKIFCAMLSSPKNFGSDKQMLKSSVEGAKLILQECMEKSK